MNIRMFRTLALALCLSAAGSLAAQTFRLDSAPPIGLTTSSVTSAVSVDIASGSAVIRSSTGSYNHCSVQSTTPPPTINSFDVTPAVVEPGAGFTVLWTASNATHCTPTQGGSTLWNSGAQLPLIGSMLLTAPTTPGTVNFQLTCTNGTQSATATTSLTVQSAAVTCPATYPLAVNSSWDGIFNFWPGYGIRRRLTPPANGYSSYRFVANGSIGQFGTIATGDFPDDGDGWGLLSISRSPGCFTASQLGPNCLGGVQRLPTISWKNGPSSAGQCSLTPGQTYYVNFTYGSTSIAGAGPYCPAGTGRCGADVQNQEQD
jgi:hypothetical protein